MSDRLLLFSQSLFTLNLLEEFLQQRAIPGNNTHLYHNIEQSWIRFQLPYVEGSDSEIKLNSFYYYLVKLTVFFVEYIQIMRFLLCMQSIRLNVFYEFSLNDVLIGL